MIPAELAATRHYPNRQEIWAEVAPLAPTTTWAEFGVMEGASAKALLGYLPEGGELLLFDSGKGIPVDWERGGTPVVKRGRFARGFPEFSDSRVRWVRGWYADTLPEFNWPPQFGLVHIDCDVYLSASDVMKWADPAMLKGTVVIFDELIGYPNYEEHEYRALCEWRDTTGKDVCWLGRSRFAAAGVVC
jgi:hypothetical protein